MLLDDGGRDGVRLVDCEWLEDEGRHLVGVYFLGFGCVGGVMDVMKERGRGRTMIGEEEEI